MRRTHCHLPGDLEHACEPALSLTHALGEPRIGFQLARTGNAAQNTRRRGPVRPICNRRPIFQAWTTRSNTSFRATSPPEIAAFRARPAKRLCISEGALHHNQPIASNHGCAHSRLKIPLACLITKAKTRPHIRPGACQARFPRIAALTYAVRSRSVLRTAVRLPWKKGKEGISYVETRTQYSLDHPAATRCYRRRLFRGGSRARRARSNGFAEFDVER